MNSSPTLSAPVRPSERAPRPTAPDDLARLIPTQAIYRPSDAARLCGISEDRVTDAILKRPRLFPDRQWRNYEWDADEFVKVIFGLCSVSPRARRAIEKRVEKLGAKINAETTRELRG